MAELFRVSSVGLVQVIRLALPQTPDSTEFDRLNETLLSTIAERAEGSWVVDLSDIAYAGSAVLGLLVNVRQRIKEAGGRLVLCGLSGTMLQIFQTCSLEKLFLIRKSQDEAVRHAE
jgi:anti-sigma B factor antagonist